jgi:glycosyltransferase involved in cell wall biosynthesis
MADRPRVALVVQRYGADLAGGSEQLCRSVAERLCASNSCDVITTRAKDYVTWQNEFPAGQTACHDVNVIRFSVDAPRDIKTFNRLSNVVLNEQTDIGTQEEWMKAQGPYSSDLLSYIDKSRNTYDAFIFFTYLYCTTYFGLPLVRDRALLVPTAHDEPPIYLSMFDGLFRGTRRFLFLTPEEQDFVLKRFCLPEDVGEVGGYGMEPLTGNSMPDPGAEAPIISAPYMLYLGRIDESKGCKVLLEWFEKYSTHCPHSDLHLVLAGKAAMAVPANKKVLVTGFVPESAKANLIRNAAFMVTPSPYESLCISALESWMHGIPVLANGSCLVLAGQCRRSQGGLWYRNYAEFAECISLLSSDSQLRSRLGASGREYVLREFAWDQVEQRYQRGISLVRNERQSAIPDAAPKT